MKPTTNYADARRGEDQHQLVSATCQKLQAARNSLLKAQKQITASQVVIDMAKSRIH